jgi:Big-like domain-containing protein
MNGYSQKRRTRPKVQSTGGKTSRSTERGGSVERHDLRLTRTGGWPGNLRGVESVELDGRRSMRLTGSGRRLLSAAVLCTASMWWLGAAAARADTPPSNDGGPPTISGVAQQGSVLTASPGGWSGDQPITFSYAWSDGQTGSSVTLSAADVGQSLTVTVSASNAFGQGTATSDSFGPVLPAPPALSDPPAPPGINGTAQQGDTLSVSTGTWTNNPTSFGYVWEDCDGSGNNCSAITGATSSSYTLQLSDVGSTIVASVTASNAGGHTSATSAGVGPVLPAPPSIGSTKPAIAGVPQQGITLNVSNGTWNNTPTSFSYLWEDCDGSGNNCSAITGATASSYTLQPSDVGSTVVAQVTASNAGGQGSSTSGSVGPVLLAPPSIGATKPAIAGVPQQGITLSVTNGSWNNTPTSFSYLWEDCDSSGANCTAIAGATSSSYKLQASDVGSTIVAIVTATNPGGSGSASDSAGPVLPAVPTKGQAPVITGTVQQGHTLTVSSGTWNNTPTSFSYLWEDCDSSGANCTTIAGAGSSSYVLQTSDVGSRIVAVVTASNAGGSSLPSPTTATTSVLPAAPVPSTAPGISGIAQQGKTLTASSGAWSNKPTSFAYSWQDCDSSGSACSPISGATSSTYILQASDVGQYVSVQVTASNLGGHGSVLAASVGPVLPPAPANTALPAISPSAGTLSVSSGSWTNATTYGYAWESCNSSAAGCSLIPGATSNSYALSAADIGATIVCVVTATGPGGSTSVTTAPTGVVLAQQIPVASQPTTTDLLATPGASVTNQSVTLIATVTAGTSSTALWGSVTFERGGAAIPGCAHMPTVPSGRSATVACSTSFAAATMRLNAVFTPTSGSILEGSASPDAGFTVGQDSSSTTLTAPSTVSVGAGTTFTAAVASPASRPGPVHPTGSVEFLDGSTPIGPCASQPLTNGTASCTVSYVLAGAHQITARYSGDANFIGSSSPAAPVSAVPAPSPVLGTISATMQWAFYFTPRYTVVRNLVVNGASPGAKVVVRCQGRGCPFVSRATMLTKGKRCGRKANRACTVPGTLNLTASFAGRHLKVGARITITIVRPSWVGKSYRFTVRSRRGPRVQIGALPAA